MLMASRSESPIQFMDLYNFFTRVIGWIKDIFDLLTDPIEDWLELDLNVDNVIVDAIEDLINYVLEILTGSSLGGLSLIELCFGSGFTFIMVLLIVKFVASFL